MWPLYTGPDLLDWPDPCPSLRSLQRFGELRTLKPRPIGLAYIMLSKWGNEKRGRAPEYKGWRVKGIFSF